ncbi:MAG: pilin [Betaproteobacteria bacterium]|nr:pilin [Betaproteobacteria bacterium]
MTSQPEVKRKKAAIIVFVVAQLIVAGLLWVVFSGTDDRAGRVKVALAVANAGKIQDAIAGYYAERNTLPADSNALRLPDKQAKPYLADLDEHADPSYTVNIANGVITLTFSANQEPVSGKTLIFVPRISNGKLDWSCDTGSVEAIYRPPQCGGQQT